MFDWNDMRFVLETVRHGGLSGAARALRVNHATVSRRITAVETALGTRLFNRHASGYTPTDAGHEAARVAEQMEAAGHDLTHSIGARDQKLSGVLTVTAPELLVERILAPLLARFIERYPDIELRLVAVNRELDLGRMEADVAFRISDNPGDLLVGRRVAEQNAAVYVGLEQAERLSINPELPLDWVRFAHWPGPPPQVTKAWPNRRVRLVVDDMQAAVAAVRANIGATRMACFLGDSDPAMVRLPRVPVFPYRPLWVLTHPDLRKAARVAAFTDFAHQEIALLRPLFEGRSLLDQD
ncbi:MAG: LysR family transcriptional regulator [Sulfitobacter sp.]